MRRHVPAGVQQLDLALPAELAISNILQPAWPCLRSQRAHRSETHWGLTRGDCERSELAIPRIWQRTGPLNELPERSKPDLGLNRSMRARFRTLLFPGNL